MHRIKLTTSTPCRLLLFLLSYSIVGCLSNLRSKQGNAPPLIIQHPVEDLAFRDGEAVVLNCVASGSPTPVYQWLKNDQPFNVTNVIEITQTPGEGTIALENPRADHEGVYQCFASNEFGSAISVKTTLRRAVLEPFPSVQLPKIHKPLIGASLTLSCIPPRSHPSAVVYWGENKFGSKLRPIEYTDRISQDYEGKLHISNILANDSRENATYICVAENTVLRSLVQGYDQVIRPSEPTKEASLQKWPINLMWSSPTTVIAIKGRELRMKCIFSGLPTPRISWTRTDKPLNSKAFNASHGQELVIPNVSHEDAGRYRCIARNSDNPSSSLHQSFHVTVESAPFWRQQRPPVDVTATVDETAEFDCYGDGVPKPKIAWTFNGVPERALPRNPRRIMLTENKIRFINLTKSDTQVLQCNVSNRHGYILANAYLNVLAEAPSFYESPKPETKVAEGNDVTIACRASGAPRPGIRWFRKSGKTFIPVTGARFVPTPQGDLEIKNVSFDDVGVYQCTASNKFGSDTASGSIVVRNKTSIVLPPIDQTVNISQSIQLKCEAITDPREFDSLNLFWRRDNGSSITDFDMDDDMTDDDRVSITGRRTADNRFISTLTIPDSLVSDTANYSCRAENGVDDDEAQAMVIVRGRPSPPTDVQLVSCLTTRAELTWLPGHHNNVRISAYSIYYFTSYGGPNQYVEALKTSALDDTPGVRQRATVVLHPWADFTLVVTAWNEMGESDRSAPTHGICTTPADRPHKNPKKVCTRNGVPSELIITWEPMNRSDHNGEGFHYVVTYKLRGDTSGKEFKEVVMDGLKREVIINAQESFKQFEISVQAGNKIGMAPGSSVERIIGHSSEGTPTIRAENFRIVPETLNGSSVQFAWDPVDDDPQYIKGYFIGYRVFFWRKDNKTDIRTEDVILRGKRSLCSPLPSSGGRGRREMPDQVRVSTNQLWAVSKITAVVSVLNGGRAGVISEEIQFETPEGVPGPVGSFMVTEKGTRHMVLQWSPPVEANGQLTGYVITYKEHDRSVSDKEMTAVTARKDPLIKKIYGLKPDTPYIISIQAYTDIGPGNEYRIEERSLSASAQLDKPVIIHMNTSNITAFIMWKPSIDQPAINPAGTFFVVYRVAGSGNSWNDSYMEKEHDWILLRGLDWGKTYDIAVVAHEDGVGRVYSDIQQITIEPMKEPVAVVTYTAGSWFIGLILAILLLLILLLIFCCIRSRRKGKYEVYEKEKLHGFHPENDAREPQFGEYVRGDGSTEKSLESIGKPVESETSSLAEYEETDTAKFNEDGSFIGQYGVVEKKEEPINPETTEDTVPFSSIV